MNEERSGAGFMITSKSQAINYLSHLFNPRVLKG